MYLGTMSIQHVERVDTPIDRNEVLRYLGYPADVSPDDRLDGMLAEWTARCAERARPRAVYRVLHIAGLEKRSLRLTTPTGIVEFEGAIGEYLDVSREMAALIATAGPELESLATELLGQGRHLEALIVSSVAAERAEAAAAVVIERLREDGSARGLSPTLPYSPGYCGMALTEQTKLFSLFGEETAGVELTAECLMKPLKSVSALVGLGPEGEVEQNLTPCERCDRQQCAMRR